MIVLDFDYSTGDSQTFLDEVKDHFSYCGRIDACEYRQEENF